MGFDLYALNPKTQANLKDTKNFKQVFEDKNAYFRNNVWYWHPLWNYVAITCDDILTREEIINGDSNSGQKIRVRKATKIGNRLKELLASGAVKTYKENYDQELKDLPEEECTYCKGTGYVALNPPADVLAIMPKKHKKGDQPCHMCDKTGKKEPWARNYPFEIDNVEEFADFCLNSGGFEIC